MFHNSFEYSSLNAHDVFSDPRKNYFFVWILILFYPLLATEIMVIFFIESNAALHSSVKFNNISIHFFFSFYQTSHKVFVKRCVFMVDQRVLVRVTMLTYPNIYIRIIKIFNCLDTLHELIHYLISFEYCVII